MDKRQETTSYARLVKRNRTDGITMGKEKERSGPWSNLLFEILEFSRFLTILGSFLTMESG